MTNINFTANLVKTTTIKKRLPDDKTSDCDVSIVELDKNNPKDELALKKVNEKWDKTGFNYSFEIYNEMIKNYDYDDVEEEHIFGITTQKDDFKNLDSDAILGLMVFSETIRAENEINWLQVDPANNHKNKDKRIYSHAGEELINYVKAEYQNKPIYVLSNNSALNFYKNNDFRPHNITRPNSLYYEI